MIMLRSCTQDCCPSECDTEWGFSFSFECLWLAQKNAELWTLVASLQLQGNAFEQDNLLFLVVARCLALYWTTSFAQTWALPHHVVNMLIGRDPSPYAGASLVHSERALETTYRFDPCHLKTKIINFRDNIQPKRALWKPIGRGRYLEEKWSDKV